MKQNLSEANAIILITLFVALVSSGCVKRPLKYSFESNPGTQATNANIRRTNINTASPKELEQLPGIGRALAERIVEHRSRYGAFRRVEHVMMVRGISEQKFHKMEQLISVH